LQIAGYALDPEELSRIWTTFSQPFRLSVLYEVSTVQLDRADGGRPVPERVRRVGVPDVRTSYQRPVVLDMSPVTAAPGGTLTFAGLHLEGWRVEVTISERAVAAGDPQDDSFAVTVPAGLAPGFHDVRVDIASIFRRTFLLEVKA
jgi:hypothetical protein